MIVPLACKPLRQRVGVRLDQIVHIMLVCRVSRPASQRSLLEEALADIPHGRAKHPSALGLRRASICGPSVRPSPRTIDSVTARSQGLAPKRP